MKTIVNIGTNKGCIVGVEFDKPFWMLRYSFDILPKVQESFGKNTPVIVHGWANVTPKNNEEKSQCW